MKCLNEFYSTYDHTCLKCNGADLLTRVAKIFSNKGNISLKQLELLVQPSFIFFPISPHNITRYFSNFFTPSVFPVLVFHKILKVLFFLYRYLCLLVEDLEFT